MPPSLPGAEVVATPPETPPARAEEASLAVETELYRAVVTATVPERVVLARVEHPSRLAISAADVLRGYKDVSARYVVSQNTERGWVLQLSPRIGITRHVEVRGLSRDLVLGNESVEVYRPGTAAHEDISLDYRLVLDVDVEPGTYDMPVHVTATPL